MSARNVLKLDSILGLKKLASDPADTEPGFTYFNTTSNGIRIYNGSAWTDVAATLTGQALAQYNLLIGNVSGQSTAVDTSSLGTVSADTTNGLQVKAGVLTNSNIASNASIALSKLAAVTGSRALQSDAGGVVTPSTVTSTELGYLSGATSSIQTQLNAKINTSAIGANNGVASLDASGKIPIAMLPNSVMEYKGMYNASTNTPALSDGTAVSGYLYRVSVGGTQNFGSGPLTFLAGDYVIYNSNNVWERADATDAVTSVNGLQGAVVLTTDNVNEGTTNLYFTALRAKAAAVLNSLAGSQTDQAPSVASVNTALAAKLSSVSQDTTPMLGGDINTNGKVEYPKRRLASVSTTTDFVEEEYFHAIALSASQTATVLSSFTVAFATYDSFKIEYKIKQATTNNVRIGRIRVVTNGTNVTITDDFTDTADLGISFDAAISGSNLQITYSSGANAATLRGIVKRFKT